MLDEVIPHLVQPPGGEGAGVGGAGLMGHNLGQKRGNLGAGVELGGGVPPLGGPEHRVQAPGHGGAVRRGKDRAVVPEQLIKPRRAAAVKVYPAQLPGVVGGAAVAVGAAAVHPEALPCPQRIIPPAVMQHPAARRHLHNQVAVQAAALQPRVALEQPDMPGLLHIK